MPCDPTALLAAVERSPRAAGSRDRDRWVGLFTSGGTIEDPVGSRPHTGHAQIERFYDTFIGPRGITFHRGADVVAGMTVFRDLSLEVRMGSSGRVVRRIRIAARAHPLGMDVRRRWVDVRRYLDHA